MRFASAALRQKLRHDRVGAVDPAALRRDCGTARSTIIHEDLMAVDDIGPYRSAGTPSKVQSPHPPREE
jgi:hypothetical protein